MVISSIYSFAHSATASNTATRQASRTHALDSHVSHHHQLSVLPTAATSLNCTFIRLYYSRLEVITHHFDFHTSISEVKTIQQNNFHYAHLHTTKYKLIYWFSNWGPTAGSPNRKEHGYAVTSICFYNIEFDLLIGTIYSFHFIFSISQSAIYTLCSFGRGQMQGFEDQQPFPDHSSLLKKLVASNSHGIMYVYNLITSLAIIYNYY